ncbi:MAG: protein translocase subunit SecD [Janthinobacterium lividum]
MKQEKIWGLIIIVLIALSGWVMLGTHRDPQTHRRVANYPTHYGLDIKGGVRAILQAHPERAPGVPYDEATVQHILENRISSTGIGDAVVQPRPQQKQFIIELPDVKNKDAIMAQLGTTAQMTFYYFADVQSRDPKTSSYPLLIKPITPGSTQNEFLVTKPWNGFTPGQTFRDGSQIKADWTTLLTTAGKNTPGGTNTAYAPPAPDPSQSSLLGANYDQLVSDVPVYLTPAQQQQAAALNKEIYGWNALLTDSVNANGGKPILTGADLEPSSSAHLGQTGAPTVSQVFNSKGTAAFAAFTTQHTGEIMGIVLDDAVLSAPFIQEPILDGQGEISGGFATLGEAQSLSNLLNAGALPIPLEQVQTQDIEASLGVGAVTKSLIAGGVGLALVLLFMLAYYRLPGLLADIALLIYALFTLTIFKGGMNWLFPGLVVTLTLPGIAGFILSIGMAVDANILIFERLKEELRSGKALRPAIDSAFKRAFTAIRDSNICTCITCIVLLTLGTANVRGFALTLLIGVLVSLFSAITVTRTLLYLLVDLFPKLAQNPSLFGLQVNSLIGQTSGDATHKGLNIIGRRKLFYGLSLAIIVPGLIFLFLGGLKPSIEFTGGTQIQVKYDHTVSQADVQKAIASQGFKDDTIQMADGGTTAIVSVSEQTKTASKLQSPVYRRLTTALNTLGPNTEQEFGNVGSVISKEVTSNAIQAVLIASALIVLYLALVFGIGGFVAGLRLGTSAVFALLHDILVLLGAFAIFGYFLGWEIDSLFITAMLTVIGFSVHDTVVIFDRVRENLRHKSRGENFESLVNRSIGQTLARSINTSLTVVMTLVALVVLGGQTTRLLNVALLIGILSGTYSSIFNAASILVDWENWLAKRRANAPVAVASTESSDFPANGGGSSRPSLPSAAPRPAAPGEIQISAIKAKKKGPVKRF